ncbi:MAG: NRDE family protein [Fidelibacterota bacterium]
MCTLTIRFDPDARIPVVVAANRDELYRRVSSPPSVIPGNPPVFAPRDEEAGGTWLGVNKHGLFVSITNVWISDGKTKHQGEPGTRSRGLLTLDVLRCESVEEAATTVRRLMKRDFYQYFNLAVASPTDGVVLSHAGSLRQYPMSPGVTTLLNTPYRPHVDRSRVLPGGNQGDTLPPYPPGNTGETASKDSWLQHVTSYLSQHPETCKHGKIYGTRCSHIVVISRAGDHRFWYADGPPCQTQFQDMSADLRTIVPSVRTFTTS